MWPMGLLFCQIQTGQGKEAASLSKPEASSRRGRIFGVFIPLCFCSESKQNKTLHTCRLAFNICKNKPKKNFKGGGGAQCAVLDSHRGMRQRKINRGLTFSAIYTHCRSFSSDRQIYRYCKKDNSSGFRYSCPQRKRKDFTYAKTQGKQSVNKSFVRDPDLPQNNVICLRKQFSKEKTGILINI